MKKKPKKTEGKRKIHGSWVIHRKSFRKKKGKKIRGGKENPMEEEKKAAKWPT